MTNKGSPPLTRELLMLACYCHACMGITPAYAGTTLTADGSERLERDHPRLRGNYLPPALRRFLILGSPPLTRELHSAPSFHPTRSGITPAYAGTTDSYGRLKQL